MNQTVYPYTQGDLLAHPQTYQYSDYLGASFLEAWKKNRNTARAALGGPVSPPPPKTESLSAGTLEWHLETLLSGIVIGNMNQQEFQRLVHDWIKKFEVRKQFFAAYGPSLKPTSQRPAPTRLYLRYAEVMAAAYEAGSGLPGLNVLLKVLDTLISCGHTLSADESGRLTSLILRERAFVEALAARPGASLPPEATNIREEDSISLNMPAPKKLRLDDVVFLAADTPRSKAYAQAMARRNIIVKAGVLFSSSGGGQAGQKAAPPAGHWSGAPFPLPDFSLPLKESLARVCRQVCDVSASHVNDPAILQTLLDYSPHMVIYSGYGSQIVGETLLSSGMEFLHVHAGWLPKFRGSTTTYYHLLSTGACGASAILLRNQLDGGPILAKKWFPRPPANLDIDYIYDSAIRADLLVDVLCKRAENKTPPIPEVQPEQGVMYYIIHPVLKHLARLSCQ